MNHRNKRGQCSVNESSNQNCGTSRRDFLKSVGTGLALSLTASNYRALGGVSPNERIQMGFIGLGGQGTGRLKEFMQHDDVDVAALCDVDENHLNQAVAEVEKTRGRKPKGFRDFRELLDQHEIDAVMIATPDHWHALPAIRAFQAGKDVFVEKPLSYSIGEGRAMVKACEPAGLAGRNAYPQSHPELSSLCRTGEVGDARKDQPRYLLEDVGHEGSG